MSDLNDAIHPDLSATFTGQQIHDLLDAALAIAIDGKGALSVPPRLMTVQERIKRIGDDRMNFHNQAKWLQKQLERTGK